MDVRAAVAFAPGKPLEVTTVQLDGPAAGEVLVEIRATGVCHTDEFTLSGADPEGLSKIVDWYMDGKIEIGPMITHAMPLGDINKAFALMREGKSIRSVVIF